MASDTVTATEAEAVVRAEWKHFHFDPVHDWLQIYARTDSGDLVVIATFNYPDSVQQAHAFTLQRQREIAELRYQLSLQRLLVANMDATPLIERNPHDHDDDRNALQRTVVMLEAALEEKQRGMKGAR